MLPIYSLLTSTWSCWKWNWFEENIKDDELLKIIRKSETIVYNATTSFKFYNITFIINYFAHVICTQFILVVGCGTFFALFVEFGIASFCYMAIIFLNDLWVIMYDILFMMYSYFFIIGAHHVKI